MQTCKEVTITATFVSAVLSLILPASAMSAEVAAPPPPERPPVHSLTDERARADPLRSDPILDYRWGPGDADLAVEKFHIDLGKHAHASVELGRDVNRDLQNDDPLGR
jgi:hypothetical protein